MKIFRSAQEWERALTDLLREKSQMSFPNPKCSCPKCKSHFAAFRAKTLAAPDPYAPGLAALRAAAGKRANYPPAPADSDPPGNGDLGAAVAARANRMIGPSLVTSKPDPYAVNDDARALRASDLTPDLSPGYAPRGTAPNGYQIALAARKVNQ